jgi:hypothetical protein
MVMVMVRVRVRVRIMVRVRVRVRVRARNLQVRDSRAPLFVESHRWWCRQTRRHRSSLRRLWWRRHLHPLHRRQTLLRLSTLCPAAEAPPPRQPAPPTRASLPPRRRQRRMSSQRLQQVPHRPLRHHLLRRPLSSAHRRYLGRRPCPRPCRRLVWRPLWGLSLPPCCRLRAVHLTHRQGDRSCRHRLPYRAGLRQHQRRRQQ